MMFNDILIFSASINEVAWSTNIVRTREMYYKLRANNLTPRRVLGKYKGTSEFSFVIDNTVSNKELVRNLAEEYGQESILAVTKGKAYLEYIKGDKFLLGNIKQVTPDYAETKDAYSFDISTKTFWVVE